MTHEWNLTGTYDPGLDRQVSSIMVTAQGRSPKVAQDNHPNFKQIVTGLTDDSLSTDELYELFDVQKRIKAELQRLSERITYRDDKVFFDGDEVHSKLADQVRDLVTKGLDWAPVVAFWEKVASNPSENSKAQLFTFIDNHQVTIFPDGDFVGYKGCRRHQDGILYSTHAGHAIVDGVDTNGYIPNEIGSVIEMPRSEVKDDPHSECNAGLHIGTYHFANDYARNGSLLIVKVNPRDVVSVPHASTGQKLRVCRYTVIDEDILEALQETVVGEDEERAKQADVAVEELKSVYAKKIADDDGVIKIGSHVRLIANPNFTGTVVALENYHGELTIRKPHIPDWVAERKDLEVVTPTIGAYADELEAEKPVFEPLTTPAEEQVYRDERVLRDVLAQAVAKAKRAKKSEVLIREMKNAGYVPKVGSRPTPSRTTAEDWDPDCVTEGTDPKGQPELVDDPRAENPTEEEFATLQAEARAKKKGLLAYGRQKGWLFIAHSEERTPEGVRVRTNWARRKDQNG